MRLDKIFPEARVTMHETPEITSLAYDDRRVEPGGLFFCVPGFTRDGHEFAVEAVRRGASALVVERMLDLDVPQVRVDSVRAAMARAAARLYGDPTGQLDVVGITGTNGKTTTSFLLHAILKADGQQTGLLGTVKSVVAGTEREVARTTPEAIDLQRIFREMVTGGDCACVMEVSSHALALHRADAVHLAAAVFTNLTQDHLDFHSSMEEYFQAKRMLFTGGGGRHMPGVAVVNVDDPYGARLAAELPNVVTFALRAAADYRPQSWETGLTGSRITLNTPDGPLELRSPLRGEFNVSNVLAALTTARALGVATEVCIRAISTAGQVPGRFQTVDEGQRFSVIVDYAHTPDSLENVLRTARALTDNRLWVVFGCGGDRDRGKRALMGEIAGRLADDVIVTSDNPRSEDPESIIAEIRQGIGRPVAYDVDRARAIGRAISEAQPGDVVILAGKGHEQGQEFADGQKIPFDDAAVARAALVEADADPRTAG